MNKQSNSYTIAYIVVMVLVVGTALAATSMALRNRQQENADADRMKQILASVRIVPQPGQVADDFSRYITSQLVVDAAGQVVSHDAFAVDMAREVKEPADRRALPVYVCTLPGQGTKYILPVYGAGLWGPIWGYIALDSDASTIYGAYFAHQGETPGLGAEIEKPAFQNQFDNKSLFKDGRLLPVAVVKKGQRPIGDEDYVDAVSGGTITSKGVSAMLHDCLLPYAAYLESLRN